MIVNPYPYSLEAKDILRYLKDIDSSLVLTNKKHHDFIKSKVGANLDVELVTSDFLNNMKLVDKVEKINFVPSDKDPAAIYYSSGTTGNPKSVVFYIKILYQIYPQLYLILITKETILI